MYNWYYLFTFWLYIAFILYYFKIISYNPIYIYIFIIFNDLYILPKHIINYGFSLILLTRLFFIISTHLFPTIYLLKNYKNKKINKKTYKNNNIFKDNLFYFILFILYLLILENSNISIKNVYNIKLDKIYNFTFKEYIRKRFNLYIIFIIWIIICIFMNFRIINKNIQD